MNGTVTMYATDRALVRSAREIIGLAVNHLDGIAEENLCDHDKKAIAENILKLTEVMKSLMAVDMCAVTYQFRPGQERPC